MSTNLGPLGENGQVIIIGGGPGGVGCALALQRLARQMGRSIEITIVEGKQFTGERHYNQCAGVLSPPLPSLMEEELDLPFPYHLSRDEIQGYILHTDREQVTLHETGAPSIALRRVQFDAYMLESARERGITIRQARVVDMEILDSYVVVYTENAPLKADVVVGAFGLDEGTATMFARLTPYRPPKFLNSVVTKFHPGDDAMYAFGDFIHAFLPSNRRIEFGAVTPKGNHLTINIAGERVDIPTMQAFLHSSAAHKVLPDLARAGQIDAHDLRFFKGRFPRSLAKHYYGHRYVMVGDSAGLVRAFKGKGVTSAVLTGVRAAHTILEAGVSHEAFHQHYRRANMDIIGDLPYGQVMRFFTNHFSRYHLLDPVVRAAQTNPYLEQSLFDAVSAHASYKQVMGKMMHSDVVRDIIREMLGFNRRAAVQAEKVV